MEEQRQGDLRVPIIFAVFCLFVLAGGVILILYVFSPDSSAPWYPMAALVLIGSPWIFWFMTYIYTCIKSCYRRVSPNIDNRQISKRTPRAASTNTAMNRTVSSNKPEEQSRDGNEAPHMHFGEVVVQGDQNSGRNGGESGSVASSTEIEMPLNVSVSS